MKVLITNNFEQLRISHCSEIILATNLMYRMLLLYQTRLVLKRGVKMTNDDFIIHYSVYPDDEVQDHVEDEEKNRVIESFCKKITASSIIEKDLPKLPPGYKVQFFRLCQRTEYDFHPNTLIVSKEKVLINTNTDRVNREEDLVSNF